MAGQGDTIGFVGDAGAAAAWAGPGAVRVDVSEVICGGFVVPGFVDCHVHAHGAAAEADFARLEGTSSAHEAIQALAGASRRQGWVLGAGWNDGAWNERPHRAVLDRAFADVPVALRASDGHRWWANSVALAQAGISGGDGVLHEREAEALKAALPRMDAASQARHLQELLGRLAGLGLTCVHDMWVSPEGVRAYADLGDRAPVRARLYVDGESTESEWWSALARAPMRGRTRVQGVKFFVDGALGSRGARLSAPYSDDPDTRGRLWHAPRELAERLAEAARCGWQPAAHAIGDEAFQMALAAFEHVRSLGQPLPRPRLEHAQMVSPLDLDAIRGVGIAVSWQPTHAHMDAPWIQSRVGAARRPWCHRARSLLQAGAVLGASSDFPVAEAHPLRTLWAGRVPAPGMAASEAVTARQALHAHTEGAAWLAGDEGELGRLAPGMSADFAVLSGNPMAEDPQKLLDLSVVATVCAGRVTAARFGG